MAQTGLIDKIIQSLDATWEADKKLKASPIMQDRNKALSETLELLKNVKIMKDIKLALGVEEFLLRQEQAVYANSPEQHNSITTAIEQLQEAKQSLAVVQDSKSYQAATATYSGKKKEAGLPLDSFRDFLKSHSTRLTNRMTSQLPVPEKNVLRQRKENLGMVREVYMGMQRKAMGIAPDRAKSLER